MSLISHDVACGLSDVIIAHAISSKKKKKYVRIEEKC
jgi:hypothetical protein